MRAVARERRGEHAAQHPELRLASDQRGLHPERATARGDQRCDRTPCRHRFLAAFDPEQAERLVADRFGGRRLCRGPDDHGTRCRSSLEARCRVDDVTHGGVIAAGSKCTDKHLTRVDPDAQLGRDVELIAHQAERLLHLQRGSHRPLGVVLMRDRGTKQGDDRVPHDLVDLAAERLDVGDQPFEASVDEVLHVFGIRGLGEGGEAHEVGEHHRGNPPLVGSLHQTVAASRAESGVVGRAGTARRTGHGARIEGSGRSSPGRTARVRRSGPVAGKELSRVPDMPITTT